MLQVPFLCINKLTQLKIHSVQLGPCGIMITVLHPSPIIPLPENDRKHVVTRYWGDNYIPNFLIGRSRVDYVKLFSSITCLFSKITKSMPNRHLRACRPWIQMLFLEGKPWFARRSSSLRHLPSHISPLSIKIERPHIDLLWYSTM